MDKPFAKGTSVRQAIKPVEGAVTDIVFDADNLQFKYLVSYKDADGADHQRWFLHNEIEEITGGAQ